jgi:SAM-dependent methyltransferase
LIARQMRGSRLALNRWIGTEIGDQPTSDNQAYRILADAVTKFNQFIYVFGWFHHPEDTLTDVFVVDDQCLSYVVETGMPHAGVANLGTNLGFRIQIMRRTEQIDDDLHLVFMTKGRRWKKVRIVDLCRERTAHYSYYAFERRFLDAVNAQPDAKVLDIGGRDRSGLDRSRSFTSAAVTVLDILPGDNVDIVGDAHAMGSLLPPASFDAIYSISVFEHLLMPWAVAVQMNQVLKPGGVAFIATHQAIGMHDIPWDFWRFSDTAWDGIFNHHTGFEIIERKLDCEQFIIPFVWSPAKQDADRSAGFEVSAVWVRKTGEPRVSWNVTVADITKTLYPE